MGKGGVSDSERIRISSAITSISPVFRFSFTAAVLFATVPVTATTYSLRRDSAFANPSLPTLGSSNTICSPERSRKSAKIRLPRFLRFCIQPITVTCWPILLPETSVHLWLLCNPFIDSAIILPPEINSAFTINLSVRY